MTLIVIVSIVLAALFAAAAGRAFYEYIIADDAKARRQAEVKAMQEMLNER